MSTKDKHFCFILFRFRVQFFFIKSGMVSLINYIFGVCALFIGFSCSIFGIQLVQKLDTKKECFSRYLIPTYIHITYTDIPYHTYSFHIKYFIDNN